MENLLDDWKDATLGFAALYTDVTVFRLNAKKIVDNRNKINSTIQDAGEGVKKRSYYKDAIERHNSDKGLVMNQGFVILNNLKKYRTSVPEEFVEVLSQELSQLEKECSSILSSL